MTNPRSLFQVEIIAEWIELRGFHIKDMGLLASAIERPWLRFDNRDLYPDVWHKAAAILDSMESSYPLHDGNKRVGVLLCLFMLASHGIDDEVFDEDDLFNLACDVAKYHPEVSEIAFRLQELAS